ncbi:DUF5372 family protein [Pseudoroseomonas wenyumeiae]
MEVTYPFHPLFGSMAVVIGDHVHNGTRHLTLRLDDGTSSLVPAWMTGADGAALRVVNVPRLPLDRLLELRALLDSPNLTCRGLDPHCRR